MTFVQQIITIALCVIGTMATRFLPFIIFSDKKPVPKYITYLGNALPGAIFAMLVIYCLKNVEVFAFPHALPETISIIFIVILHLWKKNMLLSIAGGTILYMVLVQYIF